MQKKIPGPDTRHEDAPSTRLQDYAITDPQEFISNLFQLWQDSGKAMSDHLQRSDASMTSMALPDDVKAAGEVFSQVSHAWMADPNGWFEAQRELLSSYGELWQNTAQAVLGADVTPVAEPEPGDNRFKDPEWSENQYFSFLKQTYLLTTRWAEDIVADAEGLDEPTRQKADFYLRQITSALSPSNFPMTNTEVLRETLHSNAGNLVRGMENLLADMGKSGDVLKISQTDLSSFEVGRNIAMTPGKVVYQNDLLQLIQYKPTTTKVHARPLLIVPPWINKFYILDLTAKKSFIKFAVDQGFTVFIISWVNPDGTLKDKTFEDYMKEGVLSAADAVARETGQETCNVIGYCVGGTLVSTTLAYLAARGRKVFHSATFFAAQVDFSKAGDLLIFIDDTQLKALEEMMAERGYLDGSRMATVFNMLRPRDLIWPYVVNNYMLGKSPFPFDLLFWNQDSTRMPAANHSFYLRQFYQENRLARGELVMDGIKLDLSKVKLPIYELAAREDHIAPLQSVFIGSKLFGGKVKLVVSGSGHIAGVINPPDKVKYQYWTNKKSADTLEDWLDGAKEHPGSWWPDWQAWLAKHSGAKVPARKPGAKLGVIEAAPGSYVKIKS